LALITPIPVGFDEFLSINSYLQEARKVFNPAEVRKPNNAKSFLFGSSFGQNYNGWFS
jgi:hypothetical protein